MRDGCAMDWIDVKEAAGILGVDPRQVRNLIAQGDLVARKVGGVWLVEERSVRDRARFPPGPGRPVSASMSWLLLAALAHAGSSDRSAWKLADSRHVRWRLARDLEGAPPAARWPAWLRHRGKPHRMWLHPGAIERFASDPRVVHPDPSSSLGLAVSDLVPFYVADDDLDDVVADHQGQLGEGDLEVMAVPGIDGAFDWRDAAEAAALVDLASARDARVADAAQQALDAAIATLLTHEPA